MICHFQVLVNHLLANYSSAEDEYLLQLIIKNKAAFSCFSTNKCPIDIDILSVIIEKKSMVTVRAKKTVCCVVELEIIYRIAKILNAMMFKCSGYYCMN